MTNSKALFIRQGDTFIPTKITTGPWRADAMHGGPPGALVGHLVNEHLEPDEIAARINIDLERPVPLLPLVTNVERRNVSRRVSKLDILISSNDKIVIRASAVLLSKSETAVTNLTPELPPVLPGPEARYQFGDPFHDAPIVYSRDGIEIRKVSGGFGDPLPTIAWVRTTANIVADEPDNGLALLGAIADYGSPFSQSASPHLGFALINIDVNITLARPPIGPWFLLDATREMGNTGIGMSIAHVSDKKGVVGVITQSQLIQPTG